MPGMIDINVNICDPGRTDWEDFTTATKAAASGGFTTIIDNPIYSIPTTTTAENLKIKVKSAQSKIFVDVGFWGGIIPGNENHLEKLSPFVIGFKCHLSKNVTNSISDFQPVTEEQLIMALEKLTGFDTIIAVCSCF